ncbi:hypothetical protein ACH5RR_022853 [Cinchona calisaya]|uniref:Uncharacterized protein n=1 Tax=Cinchona calisaya TaxID=153742 RepID=A0ABD2ZAU4_9GENT
MQICSLEVSTQGECQLSSLAGIQGAYSEVSHGMTSFDIEQLFSIDSELFEEPKTLLLERMHNHNIPLKNDAQPVNVRPYRYRFLQKNEIERQVKELFAAGIIQPSVSLFSSLIVLVKKKDGT